MASFGATVIDFLGNAILGGEEPETITVSEAVERAATSMARYRWMRVAYETVVGYVIASLVKCPIRIRRSARDGPPAGQRRLPSFEEDVWNTRPNPNQSHAEFVARLVSKMYLSRKGYSLVVPREADGTLWVADSWVRRRASETDPLRWWAPDTYESISINGVADAVRGPLTADEVYVFRAPETPNWRSLMRSMDDAYEQMARSAVEAFGDKNARRWLLQMDAKMTGTAAEQEKINNYLREYVGPFVTGNDVAVPLWQGMQLGRAKSEYAGDKSSTLDVVQIRSDAFRTVANCMRVPVSFLEGNVNNYETVLEAMLSFAIDPTAKAIEDEIAAKSFTSMQRHHGSFARVDTTHIRHVDLFAVADRAEKLVGSMIDSPNEIRELTGQERVDRPGMDDYQMTKNHERAGGGENNDENPDTDAADG